MSAYVEAFVTPKLITWARKRAGLEIKDAADKLQVPSERFLAWETEQDRRPTFRQARDLARILHIPFGYLFLSEPPSDELSLPDLRTVAGLTVRMASPELSDAVNDALTKQQWYREYQEEEGAQALPFVGRYRRDTPPIEVADSIRSTFGIDNQMRAQAQTWEDFLRLFIVKAEDQGVVVLRNGVVGNNNRRPLDVKEFRGFVISDDLAPLIFVNGRDAKAAQIFTLAHEIAHLWIGASGVLNPDYSQPAIGQVNDVEVWCDQVAAETLVPAEDFFEHWDGIKELEHNLGTLARRYRVSRFVVLRRAYDLGRISPDIYRESYQQLLAEGKPSKPSGGGDFHATVVSRNSRTLTTALLGAAMEGRVSRKEAASLLNVKTGTLAGIGKHLFGGQFSG